MARRQRLAAAAAVLLLATASFSAGYFIRGDRDGAADNEPGTSCDLLSDLQTVDQALADAVAGSYNRWDTHGIRWRQLMGDIRNSVRYSEHETDQQIEDATWHLDRARLGVSNEPWPTEMIDAWASLSAAAEAKCGIVLRQ